MHNLLKENLCNGFGIPGQNMTTPTPVTMTTTNTTMHCWYGISHNGSTPEYWQTEVCAPQVQLVFKGSCRRSSLGSHTGLPIKVARFSKLKNISDLLSDDKEGKIKENMD